MFRNVWGWLYGHWSDLSQLTLVVTALIFTIIPGTVSELERRPRWGQLWKWGWSTLVLESELQGCFKELHIMTN